MRFVQLETYRLPEDGDDWAPAWDRAMESGEPQISLPRGVLKFRSPMRFRRNREAVGCGVDHTELRFIGTTAGAVMSRHTDAVWRSDDARLSRCTLRYDGGGAPVATADGVVVEAPRVVLWDLKVLYFPRDGVHVDADVKRTPASNANLGLHMMVTSGGHGRHGFFWLGGDANAQTAIACDGSGSAGDGFHDASFLGNSGFGLHTASNQGASYVAEGASQRGLWAGYAEGDQDPARITRGNLAVNMRSVADPAAPAARVDAAFGKVVLTGVESAPVGSSVRAGIGSTDPDSALDLYRMSAPGDAYRLTARTWGGMAHTWAFLWKGASSLAALAMTTAAHARGPGFPVLPRGALLGLGSTQRLVSTAKDMPAIEAGAIGDLVYCSEPVEGGPAGWQKVTGPNGAYWRAI